MKKQTVSLLVLLLAASGFFFSCGNTMNKNAGALEFDSIQVNETAHLFGDTAKPACNLIINLAYASQSSDEKMKDSLNTYFLSACFGEKYMGMTPEEAVKKYTEKYGTESLNACAALYYDAMYMLVQAAENAGGTDTASLVKGMTGMSFTGVGGDITLDENGDAIKSIAINTYIDGEVKWTETLGSDGTVVSKAE